VSGVSVCVKFDCLFTSVCHLFCTSHTAGLFVIALILAFRFGAGVAGGPRRGPRCLRLTSVPAASVPDVSPRNPLSIPVRKVRGSVIQG
jgi:hypothetical protein